MRKLLGGLFLILGGGLLGLAYRKKSREELLAVREMLLFLEEMKSEICRMQTPMPMLLEKLREHTALFSGERVPMDGEGDFEENWRRSVGQTLLKEDCRRAICEMGISLSRGADCEKTVEMAQDVLRRDIARREDAASQEGRLPAALGLCGGALLAILFS